MTFQLAHLKIREEREMKEREKNGWPLARFVIPAYSEVNIFSRQAKRTTALGPIMVATAANKVWGWNIEVIDENSYRKGPRDSNGLPDHEALQRERPARVVGFYCGLSSTIERVWGLADFYQKKGVVTIAGGWHAHYCPEETLSHNIDMVVHGDGENIIRDILLALQKGESITNLAGVSYLENGRMKSNPPDMLEITSLDEIPYPDFNLLRHAKITLYPIGRVRGCRMNCEFCSIKKKNPRWSSPEHLFEIVNQLVETRKAKQFFIVDDRLEEDLPGTLSFFRMISGKYGGRLDFTVQVRLEAAQNGEFLEIMKKAGVRTVCIGYESPVDEELKAMGKGYSSARMLELTKIWRKYFRIHAMFIFGYPLKDVSVSISATERIKRLKDFLRKARPDTIQILHPIPLAGTDLRRRLMEEGRVYPQDLVPWSKYDGSFVCFRPDNMSIKEFQESPMNLMKSFYTLWSIPKAIFKFSLPTTGFTRWHRGWWREVLRTGARFLVEKWEKRQRQNAKLFIRGLENHNAKGE